MLIEDIIKEIKDLKDAKVSDVRIGVYWCAVQSRHCGLAMTFIPQRTITSNKGFVKRSGELTKKSALELAEYAKSWNLTEASLGVATINSLIEPQGVKYADINMFDFIYNKFSNRKNKIAIIGHFLDKQIDILRKIGDVFIIEKNPQEGDLPDTAAEYILPESDIVVITGTTIINKSIERLLQLSKNAFTVVVVPTTPMSDVLFDYGADVIAGVYVKNPERVMRKISEGGSLADLKEDLEFLIKIKEE